MTFPEGSNGEVQYEDSGVFGGDSSFTFNKTTKALTATRVNASSGVVSGNLVLPYLNCTSNTNGGALTTDSSGNVVCSNDDSTSGSGAPGGSSGYVQYNDGGALNGHSGLTYNSTNQHLIVGSSVTIGGVKIGRDLASGLVVSSPTAIQGTLSVGGTSGGASAGNATFINSSGVTVHELSTITNPTAFNQDNHASRNFQVGTAGSDQTLFVGGASNTVGVGTTRSTNTFNVEGNIGMYGTGEIRSYDSDNTNYFAWRSSESMSSNVTLRGPPSVGTAQQVLHSDGMGGTYFDTPASGATSLAVAEGGVTVSSPTTIINADSSQFNITLTGGATANFALNPSSVTLLGADPALGGDLSGTLSAAVVANDSHNHTGATISGLDISDDTNLAVTAPITLTGDTVGIDKSSVTLLGPSIDLATEVTGILPNANLPTDSTNYIHNRTTLQASDATFYVASGTISGNLTVGGNIRASGGLETLQASTATAAFGSDAMILHQKNFAGAYSAALRFAQSNNRYGVIKQNFYNGTCSDLSSVCQSLPIVIGSSSTDHVYINHDGRVGIGRNLKNSKLHVDGPFSVGASLSDLTAMPSNGAFIQGNVVIGTGTAISSKQTIIGDTANTYTLYAGTSTTNGVYSLAITTTGITNISGEAVIVGTTTIRRYLDSDVTALILNNSSPNLAASVAVDFNNGQSGGVKTGSIISYRQNVGSNGDMAIVTNSDLSSNSGLTEKVRIYGDGGASMIEGAFGLVSKTGSQIRSLTPRKAGDYYYCSDCTTVTTCVSTGTVVGSWSLITNRTSVCQ